MTGLLDQKVATVTGAGSGIGRAVALRYAGEGARVIVSHIAEAGGHETVKQIEARGGNAIFVKADTARADDSAALEYAAHGIRVNAVGPAFIKTPLLDNLPSDMLNALAGMHPIGRLGQPAEVAERVLWLSSDKASFVTGSYYPIDGGYLSQ